MMQVSVQRRQRAAHVRKLNATVVWRRTANNVIKSQRSRACTGSRLGRQLAERYTQDRARMTEQLDVIKWACKELWGEVFHKQV